MPFMTFFEAMAIVLFRNIIFQKNKLKDFDVMIPLSIILYLLNKYLLYKVSIISFLIITSIIIVVITIRDKMKIWTCITEIIMGLLTMALCENIALAIALTISNRVPMPFANLNIVCIFITYIIAVVILNNVPKRYYNDLKRTLNKNNTFILLMINLLLVMVIGKLLFDSNIFIGVTGVQILVVVIILVASTFTTYCSVISGVKERDRLVTENSFKPILEDYIKQLRASEHEYKNHLNAIYSMILVEEESDIKEKVQNYIGNIKQSDNLNKILYVDNLVLKAVLYSKLREAEDKGIKCEYNILSSLEGPSINTTELVVIVSNLLNNALEAAEKSEKAWVKIRIYETKKANKIIYTVEVENSVDDINSINISAIMDKGYTTKGEGRGYGLDNINKIMKRVNGNILMEPKRESLNIILEF